VLLQLIPQQGMLPLYFNKDTQTSIELLKALYSAGIRTVEYTNRGEAALTNFKAMKKVCEAEMKDMYLGVGTIKNGEMAQTFIDAGCDYIICPGLVESVAKVADANNMLARLAGSDESGRGQPHSKTLSRRIARHFFRKVLECGCPLPL